QFHPGRFSEFLLFSPRESPRSFRNSHLTRTYSTPKLADIARSQLLDRHRHHRHLFGGLIRGVCAVCVGAQAHWLLGYTYTGLAIGKEALDLSERITHPFTLGWALVMNAILHLNRDEPELALQRIEAAEALLAEQQIGSYLNPRSYAVLR